MGRATMGFPNFHTRSQPPPQPCPGPYTELTVRRYQVTAKRPGLVSLETQIAPPPWHSTTFGERTWTMMFTSTATRTPVAPHYFSYHHPHLLYPSLNHFYHRIIYGRRVHLLRRSYRRMRLDSGSRQLGSYSTHTADAADAAAQLLFYLDDNNGRGGR